MNTDQGSQFTSEGFTSVPRAHDVKIGMDGRGRWMDNPFIERLWRSAKYEEVDLKACENIPEARRELAAYLDLCNTRRRYQGLEGPASRMRSIGLHYPSTNRQPDEQTIT
jgi:putative transposase